MKRATATKRANGGPMVASVKAHDAVTGLQCVKSPASRPVANVTNENNHPAEARASSDIVMLVMTDRAKAQLFRSDFALGADVSAAAGPVGGAAQASTDAAMNAEILSYARSRGLFAGVELSGAVVNQDADAMAGVYGGAPNVHAILEGEVAPPKETAAYLATLGAEFPAPT